MQIKIASRMARNEESITFHPNTPEENKKILYDLRNKTHGIRRSREELKRLFNKLNHNVQSQNAKDDKQANSSKQNKNMKVNDYIYGPIPGFPSGSWWGIRMDCSRDRVHDPFNEDYQDGPFGVTSVCTSNTNVVEDVDLGDSLTLSGGKYIEDEYRKFPFIMNYENQVPVRLIRCYNLLNKYAPKTGYRYDGIYAVTRYWVGVNANKEKYYKFALMRLVNQEPAPWEERRITFNSKQLYSNTLPDTRSVRYSSDNSMAMHSNTRKRGKYDSAKEFLKNSDAENKSTIEKSKLTPESAIVARHVFEKHNTSAESMNMPSTSSMSEGKTLLNIDQGSKAQSTNISIRTGLYDSSNSMQHDSKKNVLTSFCRATKPLTILKTNLHLENHDLLGREKSKIEMKIDGTRVSQKMQEMDVTSDRNNVTASTTTTSLTKDENDKTHVTALKNLDADLSIVTNNATSKEEKKSEAESSAPVKPKLNNNLSPVKSPANLLNNREVSSKSKEVTGKESEAGNDVDNAHGLKSLELLNSLPPDKILNLIDKEKCHPLSKLLMGNILGFTSENSVTLRTFENSEKNFKAVTDDMIASRCYKFRRRKRIPRKLIGKTDSKMQKNFVQSSTVLGPSLSSGENSETSERRAIDGRKENVTRTNTRRNLMDKPRKKTAIRLRVSRRVAKGGENEKNGVRTRLRNVKAMKTSVKKRINKKQIREIANLLIDANVGPKIRGPRNRRLRCINPVYTRRPYEPFSTMIRTLNKHSINPQMPEQGQVFRKRNKLNKVKQRSHVQDKESEHAGSSSSPNEKSENVKYTRALRGKDGETRASRSSIDKDHSTNNTTTSSKTRKRKLVSETSSNGEIQDVKEQEKEVSKPCTMDAITQCSLISEDMEASTFTATSVEGMSLGDCIRLNLRNGRKTRVKTERLDAKQMKSEGIQEDNQPSDDENYEVYVIRKGKKIPYTVHYPNKNEPTRSIRLDFSSPNSRRMSEQQVTPLRRSSAFVPVNTVDSDSRIARLRSIGFKPISPGTSNDQTEDDYPISCSSKVIKQDVAEKYNKYTNDENSVVIYMDEELQYQDIENEVQRGGEVSFIRKQATLSPESSPDSSRDEEYRKRDDSESRLIEHASLPDQDLEAPWHGWKKIVTSDESYWIGW